MLASTTVVLFSFAIGIYPLSVYLGKQTKDPDAYEFLGWFAMLGTLPLAVGFGCGTFIAWLFQRNKIS